MIVEQATKNAEGQNRSIDEISNNKNDSAPWCFSREFSIVSNLTVLNLISSELYIYIATTVMTTHTERLPPMLCKFYQSQHNCAPRPNKSQDWTKHKATNIDLIVSLGHIKREKCSFIFACVVLFSFGRRCNFIHREGKINITMPNSIVIARGHVFGKTPVALCDRIYTFDLSITTYFIHIILIKAAR